MTNSNDVDWPAAETVAAGLGIHTRALVAAKDVAAAREWALRMVRDHDNMDYAFNRPRAASYLELAVLLGHEPEPVEVAA